MRFGVHILAVSAGRSPATEDACTRATQLLTGAGHYVLDSRTVRADTTTVQRAIRESAAHDGCQVVVLVGCAGVDAKDVVPDALAPLLSRAIPGFSELFRLIRYRDEGSAAALSRASAGVVGDAVAFSLPGDRSAVDAALEELILPQLEAYVRAAEGAPPLTEVPAPTEAAAPPAGGSPAADAEIEDVEDDAPTLPPPEPRWRLGTGGGAVAEASHLETEAPTDTDGVEIPDRGWKRAVYDLEAEIVRGKSPDLPSAVEDLAPAMDVLHQAGEVAQLKFPNGNRMTLFGYPDLQRAGSKVLAVGWGEPFAEVVALHRYPVQAGLCIEEARGLMPRRDSDIAEVAKAVTGRVPDDKSGQLCAVDHDAVYIQRGKRIYRWDGRRERVEGTITQMLVSLLVDWHAR